MSNKLIRKALEQRLAAMPAVPAIAYENVNFNSVEGTPFITVNFMFSAPDDVGFRDSPFIQNGYLQLTLFYPVNQGPGAAESKAEDFRKWFARSFSFAVDGATVVINRTPEISGGSVEEGRYVVRVYIRFRATVEADLSNVTNLQINGPANEW